MVHTRAKGTPPPANQSAHDRAKPKRKPPTAPDTPSKRRAVVRAESPVPANLEPEPETIIIEDAPEPESPTPFFEDNELWVEKIDEQLKHVFCWLGAQKKPETKDRLIEMLGRVVRGPAVLNWLAANDENYVPPVLEPSATVMPPPPPVAEGRRHLLHRLRVIQADSRARAFESPVIAALHRGLPDDASIGRVPAECVDDNQLFLKHVRWALAARELPRRRAGAELAAWEAKYPAGAVRSRRCVYENACKTAAKIVHHLGWGILAYPAFLRKFSGGTIYCETTATEIREAIRHTGDLAHHCYDIPIQLLVQNVFGEIVWPDYIVSEKFLS